MIVGTWKAIAAWGKATIETVPNFNKVWAYRRKIRTLEQLREDFGTGVLNEQDEAITRGWMVDVASSEPNYDAKPMGKTRDTIYSVLYIFFQSIDERGAEKDAITDYVETVANALQAEARPDALAIYDSGTNSVIALENATSNIPIVQPAIISEVYTVEFPIGSGRLSYRVDITQDIRLRQGTRS